MAEPFDGYEGSPNAARERQERKTRARKKPNGPDVEGPRPLRRALPPAPRFPIEAFDCAPVMKAAAEAIEAKVRAPVAMCGNAVLAAASVCAQAHANVAMPYGATKPLSLFCVSVAETGERKTSVDEEALRPIREREAELRRDYATARREYQADLDSYTAHKAHLQQTHKKSRATLRLALGELGPEPSPPLKPLVLVDNPTVEGLETYAAEGQPSFGLFTAEGGKLIGGHLFNDDNRMKAGATLNLLWDGEPMPRLRRNSADKWPGRRLAMHIMVQPEIAARLLSDEILANLGTLARCLVVAPNSAAGSRLWRDIPNGTEAILGVYNRALSELLRREPLRGDEPNELRPRSLPLCAAARAVWVAFHDEAERNIAPDAPWASIRGLGSKLPEHAARIAGVLTIATDPDAGEIEALAIEGGIAMARYYVDEALRLIDAGLSNPDLVLAEKLLAWLHADPTRTATYPVEIYQSGPNPIREKATAQRIVNILVDHGWLTPCLRTSSSAGASAGVTLGG